MYGWGFWLWVLWLNQRLNEQQKTITRRASWPFLALKNSWKHRIIVLTGRVNKEKFMLSALNADKIGITRENTARNCKTQTFWYMYFILKRLNAEKFRNIWFKTRENATRKLQNSNESFSNISREFWKSLCSLSCWMLKTWDTFG